MRRVFTIGETGLDIIFENSIPIGAKPGGSMLNASVSLARLNVPVSFITEFGTDKVGSIIQKFLNANNVDTQFASRFNDGKSAIALAFLDENRNADYSFYKAYPKKRFQVTIPPISDNDIVLFGSYFGISSDIREALLSILYAAKSNGATIIYDPNFRKAHLNQLNDLLPFIKINMQLANIIKGSDEDFENIFNESTPEGAFRILNDPSKILFYTAGSKGAHLITERQHIHVPSKKLDPVSTVGAGDNFNAGLAFGLIQQEIKMHNLNQVEDNTWTLILEHGVNFASEVCLSLDNYISENFAKAYLT